MCEEKVDVVPQKVELSLFVYNGGVLCLQKKLRKDPDHVKPQAAATIIGSKRPPVAASRAPLCKLLSWNLFHWDFLGGILCRDVHKVH